jgi:hypothetical protein
MYEETRVGFFASEKRGLLVDLEVRKAKLLKIE